MIYFLIKKTHKIVWKRPLTKNQNNFLLFRLYIISDYNVGFFRILHDMTEKRIRQRICRNQDASDFGLLLFNCLQTKKIYAKKKYISPKKKKVIKKRLLWALLGFYYYKTKDDTVNQEEFHYFHSMVSKEKP